MKLFRPVALEVPELQAELKAHLLAVRDSRVDKKPHDFTIIDLPILERSAPLMELLEANGLTLKFCMGFWCEPHTNGLIHQDLDSWALNIPISGIGGYQTWVDVDPQHPAHWTTYGNTSTKKFALYPADTPRTPIDRLMLDSPHFVNTDILHYIDNMENDQTRMIITIRFKELVPPSRIFA